MKKNNILKIANSSIMIPNFNISFYIDTFLSTTILKHKKNRQTNKQSNKNTQMKSLRKKDLKTMKIKKISSAERP